MFNESSTLILYLSIIIIFSFLFNTFSIYNFTIQKNKISAHYICINLFIINIIFTLTSLPYYILKEANIIKTGLLSNVCQCLNDFIIFIYNFLLLLMAMDRYFYICTQIRFNGNKILIIYYLVAFLIASTSVSRVFENNFRHNVTVNKSFNSSEWLLYKQLTVYYDYFFISVPFVCILISFSFYIKIFAYVYRKSSHAKSYLPIIVINFKKDLNKSFICINGHNKELSSNSSVDNIKMSHIATDFQCDKKRKKDFNYNMIHFQMFKNTNHWIITVVFLRVNLFFF